MLKEGTISTFSLPQNTCTYQLKITPCAKGLWVCIEESASIWKLTITAEMIEQTISKASGGKQVLSYKQFVDSLMACLSKGNQKWSIGIMTPIELEVLRGGSANKQINNTKLYLILSDKEKKLHYPFTFIMSEIGQKEKLIEAIKSMKNQLQELRNEKSDKSQTSMSIMSETMCMGEQIKLQNEELKKKIKMYEESLTQKRGAVEIDMILKEKNNLQIKAETKKRQQHKEITRLKNIYMLMDRQIIEIRTEVELINKELMLLQDSVGNSAKLRSHALKVLKSYQNDLRTLKKVLQKQVKEIQALKRNINNSKNNQRKVLAKIKQIQTEIDQAKKKANIKQISNRLHSVGRGQGSSVDSSSKAPSITSSQGKPQSNTSSKSGASGNIVRQNLLKKTTNMVSTSYNRNHLLKTSPNINLSPSGQRKSNEYKPPARPVNSSHQIPKQGAPARQNPRNSSGGRSEHSAEIKKETSAEDKERQRKAMERLTGAKPQRLNSKQSQKMKQPLTSTVSQRQVGRSLQSKPVNPKKDSVNSKDILNKMKEIKAHYNGQVNKNAIANKAFAAKVAELSEIKKF